MRTITTNVYQFEELSETAQQKAIDNLCTINVDNWWECTYDDAETIGLKITSFDLDRNKHVTVELIKTPLQICWLIKENHGETCETFILAKKFLADYEMLPETLEGLEEIEEQFESDLFECYANILQNEVNYLQSKESIIETIKANEYEFTENGKLV